MGAKILRYLILTVFVFSCSSPHRNLSDGEDQNRIPAAYERRMNLEDNDAVDSQEKRREEEERIRITDPPLFGD